MRLECSFNFKNQNEDLNIEMFLFSSTPAEAPATETPSLPTNPIPILTPPSATPPSLNDSTKDKEVEALRESVKEWISQQPMELWLLKQIADTKITDSKDKKEAEAAHEIDVNCKTFVSEHCLVLTSRYRSKHKK